MFYFIYLLKTIATLLITNAHYESIYPISIIANGGLLGDVIFFFVSGFCLYNIKGNFIQWYKKRLLRIYPTVLICVFIYIIGGYWNFDGSLREFICLFIYPTKYHFISSIVFLYIIYYFIIQGIKFFHLQPEKTIKLIMIMIVFIYGTYYMVLFDKTFYHIDSVYQFSIRFLFLFCMLLGVWFRLNQDRFLNQYKKSNFFYLFTSFVIYFVSKLIFSRIQWLAPFQIINQVLICIVLYFACTTAMSLENRLTKCNKKILNCLKTLSKMTLEIYLIQYIIIQNCNISIFPLNFIVVTTIILGSAYLLNKFICIIKYYVSKFGGNL
ncbi:MAG: acyltransferase family protein [Faecalibacillus sp.]